MDRTVRVTSLVWFATGAMLATAVTVVVLQAWRVDAAPGDDDATFVPISPCRLADTRPAPNRVGDQGAFGTDDTKTFDAHGTNGDCTIPADAVGLSLNVTALRATLPTFLTIWPDGSRPTASSLNPSPGQARVPNAVTTTLASDGRFRVFNRQGSVEVIIDVNGYYTQTSLQELNDRIATAEATIATNSSNIAGLDAREPFAVSNSNPTNVNLTSTPAAYVSVTVTAPAAGQVTLNSTALVSHSLDGASVRCAIFEDAAIPTGNISFDEPSYQQHETGGSSNDTSLSGTRRFDIAANTVTTYSLACQEFFDGATIFSGNLTAVYTPTP